MDIRRAAEEDLEVILGIYEYARGYQVRTGNPKQWGDGYPKPEVLEEDIRLGRLYVCVQDAAMVGVFMFQTGDDPTYAEIRDGAWLDDQPYGVVHRIAGNGTYRGMAGECFDWCLRQCPSLRIDTHEDNRVMQHVLEKCGFTYCGQITTWDGTPRMAYQKLA